VLKKIILLSTFFVKATIILRKSNSFSLLFLKWWRRGESNPPSGGMTTTGSTSVGCDLFSQHYRPQPAYNTAIPITSRLMPTGIGFKPARFGVPLTHTTGPVRAGGLAAIRQLKRNCFLLRLFFSSLFYGQVRPRLAPLVTISSVETISPPRSEILTCSYIIYRLI